MANFLLLYSGGAAPTPADRDKIMEQWGGWFGKLGDKVVDAGNPVGHAKNVSDGGSVHDGAVSSPPASGYSQRWTVKRSGSMSGGTVTVYEITPAM